MIRTTGVKPSISLSSLTFMCSFKIIINCESLLFLEADRRKWPGLATDLLGDGERYMTGDRYEVNPKVWTDYTLLLFWN
jgi:hypothetical protein